jgi:hypothetical protein
LTTEEQSATNDLRDSEIALMDTFKVVFEIMMHAGVKPAQIDKLLASLTQQYRAKDVPTAAAVIETLRDFVRNPDRAEHREQVQRILKEPPAGSA